MKYSCGIIPFKVEDGEIYFFLGHPGGDRWQYRDFWMFLKGGVEKGENWQEAAIREFKEETGLNMEDCESQLLIPLGSVLQNSSKTVVAYGLHYPNIDVMECHSNYAEDGITLEIDKYKWMTYDEVCRKTHKTHLIFYEQLYKKLTEDAD